MADRRSTYLFEREQDYNDAKDHLYREMYQDYRDSSCIDFHGNYGSISRFDWNDSYRIDIYSNCSDAAKVADIIREHRGRYYDM